MYNPVRHVAGRRSRARVGATEFNRSAWCESTQSYFDPNRETCGPGTPPGGGSIDFNVVRKPGGWNPGSFQTPYGGGGGGGYTPPNGGGYTPPGGGGGGGGDIPQGTGGGGIPPGGYTPPSGGGGPTCAPPCNVCPENQKRVTMPFVPDSGFTATVLASAEVRFVGRPQYLFKPDRLIIGSEITPFFDVVNFIIGNKPQSLSQGSVSASMYSEVATYVDMSFDQCYPGIDVILVARNKSAVTQTFQAQLVGWADMK